MAQDRISGRRLLLGLLAMVGAGSAAVAAPAQPKLILVTIDGMRWQDLFRGADAGIAADPEYTPDRAEIRARFVDVPDRPAALMPFLLGIPGRGGILAGDRDAGSCMQVTNPHWFSYPGYSEILTGAVDPAIDSNDKIPNPAVSFLEAVAKRPGFRGGVRMFGSWDVFPFILNTRRSGLPVNAGYTALPDDRRPETALLNRLMMETPRLWDGVRLDAFTHHAALASLRHDRPRVLYVAYGETDDFAHGGRFDQYLRSAARTDAFIAELWRTAQADPFYAGQTTLIVTTDHGRGYLQRGAWKSHGSKESAEDVARGQDFGRGSNQTWLAMIGPRIVGGVRPAAGRCWGANAIAATALTALDLDPKRLLPQAGAALPVLKETVHAD